MRPDPTVPTNFPPGDTRRSPVVRITQITGEVLRMLPGLSNPKLRKLGNFSRDLLRRPSRQVKVRC